MGRNGQVVLNRQKTLFSALPGGTAFDCASVASSILMGWPEDMTNAALFFIGEESSYVTGHILEVTGGYGLGTPQYADAAGKS